MPGGHMNIERIAARFRNGEFDKAIQHFKERTIPPSAADETAIPLSKTLGYLEEGNVKKALRELLGTLIPFYKKGNCYRDLIMAFDLVSDICLNAEEYYLAYLYKQKAITVLTAQLWCYPDRKVRDLMEEGEAIFVKWRG